METRSKATRDLALSEDVIPPAEFPARIGESTPEPGDLGDIGAAGIVGDSRPSSTRPPTEVVSPHMSVHEADVDVPPLLQRADLAPIATSINPRPLHLISLNWTRPSNPSYSTMGLPAAKQETHQETGVGNYRQEEAIASFCFDQIIVKLETVSIAEPLQNRQHAQNP